MWASAARQCQATLPARHDPMQQLHPYSDLQLCRAGRSCASPRLAHTCQPDRCGMSRPVLISSRLPNILLFELSRSQIIQLICVFISPKLQLAGYLVEIIIPRYLGLVCNMSRYLSGASSPARRFALCANAGQNISS